MQFDAFPRNKDELYEQYQRALFRIALFEIAQEEIEQLERDATPAPVDPLAQRRALSKIHRALSRRRAARVVRTALPRAATAAACLVLVFALGLTTVLATSQEARNRVMKLMISRDVNFTDLSLVPQGVEAATIPPGWAGLYYPTYIPANYLYDQENSCPEEGDVRYRHRRDEDVAITFAEYGESSSVWVNSFGAQVTSTTVHGRDAVLSLKPDLSFVSWSEGDRFFLVTLNDDDQSTLLRVAHSVERIPLQDQGGVK